MHIDNIQLGPAPGKAVYRNTPEEAAAKGTILFYHGFSADISVNLTELDSLASQGFLAVGLDNAGHGRRRLADWEAHFGEGADFETNMQRLINQSIDELPDVIDALTERNWFHPGGLGICGISMGGMIAYGGMLLEPRIDAGSVFVSSPRYLRPGVDITGFAPRPLLSQTGGRDEIVPFEETEQLHQRLAVHYDAFPERNVFINYPNSEHMMAQNDWEIAWRRGVDWFERFLKA
ncbi:MAG: alpha/beta fold hydrolase [Acidobacteriota bacterium]|nr:alpha/beta fold hydrolase [Acidobacteriota bacterium]